MKSMRWPGKGSKKQQAGSQLWLETVTEMENNKNPKPNPQLRSESLMHLRAVMSIPSSLQTRTSPHW